MAMGCSAPTEVVVGVLRIMLLYPKAMPMSSAMSTAWSMSDRVGGTVTWSMGPSSLSLVEGSMVAGPSCILLQSSTMCSAVMSIPMSELMKATPAASCRVDILGVICDSTMVPSFVV